MENKGKRVELYLLYHVVVLEMSVEERKRKRETNKVWDGNRNVQRVWDRWCDEMELKIKFI